MKVKYDNVVKEFDTEKSSISNSYYVGQMNDTLLHKLPFLTTTKLELTLSLLPFQLAPFNLKR